MKVLIACEYSGRVRRAFTAKGHEVYSCDLLPSDDNSPNHIQDDAIKVIYEQGPWDLIIAHPPCTYLTNSAEWAYKDGPYHQKVSPETLVGEGRRKARVEAVSFFMKIWEAPCEKMVIENPVWFMSSLIKPSQYIQPYEYGEDASKKTCLWIRGLPLLKPTKYIPPKIVNGKPRWGNQSPSGQNKMGPSKNRGHLKSLTYQGWADAMACQWG